MTDSELDAVAKRVQEEELKRTDLLRTVSSILNLSQDIEDIHDACAKCNSEESKLGQMLEKAQAIQALATKILPG